VDPLTYCQGYQVFHRGLSWENRYFDSTESTMDHRGFFPRLSVRSPVVSPINWEVLRLGRNKCFVRKNLV